MTSLEQVRVYPNSHYVTPMPTIHQAIKQIQVDLQKRLVEFEEAGKLLEAQRLRERVTFDIEMLQSTGFCSGIENYSRYLTGRKPGSAPPTLLNISQKTACWWWMKAISVFHSSAPCIRETPRVKTPYQSMAFDCQLARITGP